MISARPLLQQAGTHWFLPLLPALLLIEYAFARSTDWSRPGPAEGAILFDLCLFVPALFILCYRRRLAAGPLLLRVAALFLLGLFVASRLVPPEGRLLLPHLSWLRLPGIGALALIELFVTAAVLKMIFSGRSSAAEIAARSGAPRWVVRLMLLEARFWAALWRRLRGR